MFISIIYMLIKRASKKDINKLTATANTQYRLTGINKSFQQRKFNIISCTINIDLRAFLSIIRKCTDLKELTPELVNRLITKIEVFDSTKDENGKKHVPIKVHFIGVGVIVRDRRKFCVKAE